MELETPKTDFYIRLNSENDLPTVFSAFYRQDTTTELDEETQEVTTVNVGDPYLVKISKDYAIDIVGVLHRETGNTLTTDTGIEYPELEPIEGWHVNVRIVNDNYREAIESIDEAWGVIPVNPRRVWA